MPQLPTRTLSSTPQEHLDDHLEIRANHNKIENAVNTAGANQSIVFNGTMWVPRNLPVISTANPLVDGTAAPGTTGDVSDAGHRHPRDTIDAANHGTGYLPDAHHNRVHSDSDHSGANKVSVASAGVVNATRATINLLPNASVRDDATALAALVYQLQNYDLPTAANHQSHIRGNHGSVVTPAAGLIRCHRIYLPKGDVVSSLTFVIATTAFTFAGTGQLFAYVLTDANRVVRAATADMSASGGALGAKTGTLASAYTVPSDGFYYAGVLVQPGSTGTMGSFAGRTPPQGVQDLPPVTGFQDTTSRTTIPATDGTVTLAQGGIGSCYYFYTSP